MERGRPHVVAEAAVPGQVDVGGLVGAGHLDFAGEEIGVEIATFGQAAADPVAAGVVGGVVEHLAHARPEGLEVPGQVGVIAAGADDGHVRLAHPHRLPAVDPDGDGDAVGGIAR